MPCAAINETWGSSHASPERGPFPRSARTLATSGYVSRLAAGGRCDLPATPESSGSARGIKTLSPLQVSV